MFGTPADYPEFPWHIERLCSMYSLPVRVDYEIPAHVSYALSKTEKRVLHFLCGFVPNKLNGEIPYFTYSGFEKNIPYKVGTLKRVVPRLKALGILRTSHIRRSRFCYTLTILNFCNYLKEFAAVPPPLEKNRTRKPQSQFSVSSNKINDLDNQKNFNSEKPDRFKRLSRRVNPPLHYGNDIKGAVPINKKTIKSLLKYCQESGIDVRDLNAMDIARVWNRYLWYQEKEGIKSGFAYMKAIIKKGDYQRPNLSEEQNGSFSNPPSLEAVELVWGFASPNQRRLLRKKVKNFKNDNIQNLQKKDTLNLRFNNESKINNPGLQEKKYIPLAKEGKAENFIEFDPSKESFADYFLNKAKINCPKICIKIEPKKKPKASLPKILRVPGIRLCTNNAAKKENSKPLIINNLKFRSLSEIIGKIGKSFPKSHIKA